MFGSTEKFSTTQEEINHLSHEAHKTYILQEHSHRSIESAAKHTVESYAAREASDFIHHARALPEHEAERIVLKLKPEAHDKKIEELFALMIDRGIKNALDVVKKLQDPHLEDDFHRFLVQYLHTIGALPGLVENSGLRSALDHTLFTIALPNIAQDENKENFKHFIQAMRQLYVGLHALTDDNQYYTLELATQNSGKDIAVYASIPRMHIEVFEKLVHAYYPGASIEEAADDYNIFSSSGSGIVGAIASLKEEAIFPLQTEDSFEHDPLMALIGSLSKLAEEGEGAAIQLVVTKDTDNHTALFEKVVRSAEVHGEPVKDLYEEETRSIMSGVGKGLLSFFENTKHNENKEKHIDTKGIELAKEKSKSETVLANLRIISAAQTISRAQTILTTIQATFNQFSRVGSNALVWNTVKATHIHELARAFSFRTISKDTLIPLSVHELATVFHFPVGLTGTPELKGFHSASAPAKNTTAAHGSVYLGENVFRGTTTPVYLSKEDRVRHCYVIGQTGTGKTTILKNMIIQDIKQGHGVCFMDPHGTDLEDILANIPPERIDDVIYFDPAHTARPMGLNMLEYDVNFPEQKIFVINELLAIFNKLFDMKVAGGPMFEQYFRNSAGLVMEDPSSGSTLLEIGRVLSDKAFRDLKLSRCKNMIIKQFWENAEKTSGEASLANFVPYITNKFDVFISNDIMRPVIAQQHSVLNFREIMDKKKILLVNLSKGRLGDINSHLIGLVLVGKLTMAALSRVDMVGRGPINDFYLYIDEFQNVTTDSIATILSEARKYRLSLTVAHQYIEQLEDKIKNAIFGNVGNMIIYRVSPENAGIFEKQLSPTFTPSDILDLENFNAFAKILVNGVPEKPFNLRIPPSPQGNHALSDKVKELSYLTYGRPREEVEAEIMARYR